MMIQTVSQYINSLGDINKLIMKVIFYLSSLLIFLFTIHAQTYTGTFTSGSTTNPAITTHTFVGAGGQTSCKIEFTITSGGKTSQSVLMIVTNGGVSLGLSAYAHQNPTTSTIYDLQNANKGQKQTVQLTGLSPSTVITMKILVFQTGVSFGWSIVVTEQAALVSKCVYLGHASPSSQYCANCAGLIGYGAYCQVNGVTLSNNSMTSSTIAAGGYVAFTIPSSSTQITLTYISDTPNVDLFIQFKTYNEDIAGWTNFVLSSGGSNDGYFPINTPSAVNQVNINSGGSDVAIGVINQNGGSINFNIQYTTQAQTINILVIVLGVLGGLLLIALIVAACFIIKRIRNPSQLIHPNGSAAMVRHSQAQINMLSGEQIEIYFPAVSCRLAFTQLQTSSLSLNKQIQSSIDRDCVICLCPVDGNDMMKVTYCRHLFHAHCLTEWFRKQRNCPYCRQEYTKSSTLEHYQSLLKETKRNMLAGVQLAQQILRTKVSKSTVIIEDMKD